MTRELVGLEGISVEGLSGIRSDIGWSPVLLVVTGILIIALGHGKSSSSLSDIKSTVCSIANLLPILNGLESNKGDEEDGSCCPMGVGVA
jgi:ABC-type transport system involved in cytochrome c biogenesis permease component